MDWGLRAGRETTAFNRGALAAALSRATDLAIGQPMGFALCVAVLADRLALACGFAESERRAVFYQAMLCEIGCNSEASALASLVGDEIAFRRDYARIDQANPREVAKLVRAHLRKANTDASLVVTFINVIKSMRAGRRDLVEIFRGQSEVAQRLAARLGLDAEICRALGQAHARWDGQGIPENLAGTAITPAARVVRLAQDMLILKQAFGRGQAIALLRERSGKVYEPKLVTELEDRASGLLAGLDELDAVRVLATLPGHDEWRTESEFEEALLAMADFIDIKTPINMGHPRPCGAGRTFRQGRKSSGRSCKNHASGRAAARYWSGWRCCPGHQQARHLQLGRQGKYQASHLPW
jgi:HD domain